VQQNCKQHLLLVCVFWSFPLLLAPLLLLLVQSSAAADAAMPRNSVLHMHLHKPLKGAVFFYLAHEVYGILRLVPSNIQRAHSLMQEVMHTQGGMPMIFLLKWPDAELALLNKQLLSSASLLVASRKLRTRTSTPSWPICSLSACPPPPSTLVFCSLLAGSETEC
jgi:hypothetical protein